MTEENRPESTPGKPAEPLDNLTRRLRLLERSVLRPLPAERSPAELLGGEPLEGELSLDDTRTTRFEVRRTAESPPCFTVNFDALPLNWEPLSVIRSQFRFARIQPIVERFTVPSAERRPPAADTSVPETPYVLSADTGERSAGRPSIPTSLSVHFDANSRLLEVTDPAGETQISDLVAEVSGVDEAGRPVRRRILVEMKSVSQKLRKSIMTVGLHGLVPGGEGTLQLRSMTAGDADLLSAHQVHVLLATQNFVAMPLKKTPAGFLFRVDEQDEQAMASEPDSPLLLQVAMMPEAERYVR